MRRICLALCLLLGSQAALAVEIRIPLRTLVRQSETIVIARLAGVENRTEEPWDRSRAQLHIEKVLRGGADVPAALELTWRNEAPMVCPRIDHERWEDKNAIWFLDEQEDGTFRAATNSHARSVDERSDVEQALRDHPFFVRLEEAFDPGEDVTFDIVFSNDTSETLVIPAILWHDGVLEHHPDVALSGKWSTPVGQTGALDIEPDLWVENPDAVLTLEPGQQHLVRVPLGQLIPLEKTVNCRFTIALHPDDRPWREEHRFRIRAIDQEQETRLREAGDYTQYLVENIAHWPENEAYAALASYSWDPMVAETLPALYGVFDELSPAVQGLIVGMVAELEPDRDRTLDFLFQRLSSEHPEVMQRALYSLQCSWAERSPRGDRAGEFLAAVAAFLDHPDSDVRYIAVGTLTYCANRPDSVDERLARLAEVDPQDAVRRAARRALEWPDGR